MATNDLTFTRNALGRYESTFASSGAQVAVEVEVKIGGGKLRSEPLLVYASLPGMARISASKVELTDGEALSVKSLYPEWETFVGQEVEAGTKVRHSGRLWKVLQAHTVQAQYAPGTGTESLYAEIVEDAAGTADDPIPYTGNMELEEGRYYSQGGVTYRCIRDTGQPVYHDLSALVGLYVEAV